MSYPLYLVAEQDQLQIVHGYDVAPVKSDRGMFMRTVPMQQAVVVDEQTSHRLLDVSNRIPPDSVRRPESIRVSKRTVGRNPRLKERIAPERGNCFAMAVLPDPEHTYSASSASASSIMVRDLRSQQLTTENTLGVHSSLVDSANKFYLFSISVIGLYMFYRVLQFSTESRK